MALKRQCISNVKTVTWMDNVKSLSLERYKMMLYKLKIYLKNLTDNDLKEIYYGIDTAYKAHVSRYNCSKKGHHKKCNGQCEHFLLYCPGVDVWWEARKAYKPKTLDESIKRHNTYMREIIGESK